jgi:anti-sigma regulatory factor (Ser/Thr protein kinase)
MTGIRLKIPHQPSYHGVALLVVGGLAARLELSYEQLEDLQLALESVLENDTYSNAEDVTVEFAVASDSVSMAIGPLDGSALRRDLEDERDDRIALGRLLGTLAQRVEVESRDDGEWLRVEKQARVAEGAS